MPLVRFRKRLDFAASAGCALSALLLGCGGATGGTGSQPPPPPAITLTSTGPYNATLQGNNWVVAGVPSFTLLATGTGFTTTSVIEWNGTTLLTQYGSSENLAATVSSTLVANPGTASIIIYDPKSGAKSNSLPMGIASPAAATAGVVQLITIAPDGAPANDNSLVTPSISATGRYVAFQSAATNLAPGPASGYQEIYERDTCIGAPAGCTPITIRISVTYDGSPVNGHSKFSALSADGRYVAFTSSATNILPDTSSCAPPYACIFLRDTCTGAANGCTPSTSQVPGGGLFNMTPDARNIAIGGGTGNLPGGPYTAAQVALWDTCQGAPSACSPNATLMSLSTGGDPENANSTGASVNSTGRYVVFGSWASNLGQQNLNGWPGIFLRDDCIGATSSCTPSTIKIDDAPDGTVANGESGEEGPPAISADGRFIAYDSAAMNLISPNLTACPTSGTPPESCGYVFLRDTCNGAASGCSPVTSIVSLGNDGSIPNGGGGHESISADGRYVAFDSIANNIVPGDTFPVNGWKDVYVRDTCFGAPTGCAPSTVRVSVTNTPNLSTESNAISAYPVISADGHYLVFMSAATNLVPGITGNGYTMVYLAKTGF